MAEEFESVVGSGASLTFPMQCNNLKKNGYVVMKGFPCKIVDMSTSKTGKHGHAKVHLVGIDIFTGKKYEDISPASHNMEIPFVTRNEYQCIEVSDDNFVSIMDDNGNLRSDIKIDPEADADLYAQIKDMLAAGTDCYVSVLKALGSEQVVGLKNATKAQAAMSE